MDASVQPTLSPSKNFFPGFTPNSPEERWLEETLKAPETPVGQRGQPGSQQTPSSATRQLFQGAGGHTPLHTVVTRAAILKSIAKKKAEIAAAAEAAEEELAALEASAGLSLASDNHTNATNLPATTNISA